MASVSFNKLHIPTYFCMLRVLNGHLAESDLCACGPDICCRNHGIDACQVRNPLQQWKKSQHLHRPLFADSVLIRYLYMSLYTVNGISRQNGVVYELFGGEFRRKKKVLLADIQKFQF
jgi:hypothetical protein